MTELHIYDQNLVLVLIPVSGEDAAPVARMD
jgi:hypothetical protein